MDLFSLISAPNLAKVKTGTRPHAAHEVPLLTATASCVIDTEDTAVASGSSRTPSAVEKSPLDFADEDLPQVITERGEEATMEVIPESSLEKKVAAMGHVVNKRRRKRGNEGAGANTPPTMLRKDYAASRPAQSTSGEKYIVPIGGWMRALLSPCLLHKTLLLLQRASFRETATEVLTGHVATMEMQGAISAESPESGKSIPFLSVDGSPKGIYQPGWGMTNNCLLDTPDACQDMVDHIVPPGYFSKLRHLPNTDFLSYYNMNLSRQVAMGSQLRLRFEQEAKNLKTRLEAEVDMKKAAEAKNAGLAKELESLLTGEERIKAAFEEFKKYEDDRVNSWCAEIDERLDALSIDFDEELYSHTDSDRRSPMGYRHGLRLAVMKCAESTKLRQVFSNVVFVGVVKGMSEGLKHGIEHGKANLDLAAIEAYDPEADAKYVAALHALKDLNSSQLKFPVYPEVRDPKDPWSFKEEILLEDAIAANISRAKKKKKCRVVCRTHGVGFAHHARSDGVPVSVPTVAPQGLAILLADAATQT
nr:hypothetical protein [Tanacetum cinerariifolium]